MEALPDWGALQSLTGSIARGAPEYTTNLYAGRDQIECWCAAGRMRGIAAERAVLLLRADRDFDHVYHVAHDLASLISALMRLPAGRYAVDLIGREEGLHAICDAYRAAGFAPRAFLRRMNRARASVPLPPTGGAEVAIPGDAEEVATFLDRLLDRFTEQLPELDELRQAASNGRLLVVRQGGALAGMLMYDLQGKLAHLRYWHVDTDARGAGVGRRLMASFLSRCAEAQRIVLWVMGDNDRSIAIYRHYGFEIDGLLDRVMTLNKDQH